MVFLSSISSFFFPQHSDCCSLLTLSTASSSHTNELRFLFFTTSISLYWSPCMAPATQSLPQTGLIGFTTTTYAVPLMPLFLFLLILVTLKRPQHFHILTLTNVSCPLLSATVCTTACTKFCLWMNILPIYLKFCSSKIKKSHEICFVYDKNLINSC